MIFAMMEVAQNTIRTPRRDFPGGPVVISAGGTGSTPGQDRSHMLRDAAPPKKKEKKNPKEEGVPTTLWI